MGVTTPGWEAQLAKLKAYAQEHGDCNVPRRWAADPKLGCWVDRRVSIITRTAHSEALIVSGTGYDDNRRACQTLGSAGLEPDHVETAVPSISHLLMENSPASVGELATGPFPRRLQRQAREETALIPSPLTRLLNQQFQLYGSRSTV